MSEKEEPASQTQVPLPSPPSPASPAPPPPQGPAIGPVAGRTDRPQAWQKATWLRASAFLGVVGILLCFLVLFTMYEMFAIVASENRDSYFVFAGMTLLVGTLLRFLAILVGGGAVFAGLAVSFYTHEKATEIKAEATNSAKGTLATSSPGIAAIVVGAVVIIAALFATGKYSYRPPIPIPLTMDLVEKRRPSEPTRAPASAPKAEQPPGAPTVKSSAEILREVGDEE